MTTDNSPNFPFANIQSWQAPPGPSPKSRLSLFPDFGIFRAACKPPAIYPGGQKGHYCLPAIPVFWLSPVKFTSLSCNAPLSRARAMPQGQVAWEKNINNLQTSLDSGKPTELIFSQRDSAGLEKHTICPLLQNRKGKFPFCCPVH